MDITDFKPILADFGINGSADVRPLGDGLINHTFLVRVGGTPRYVLQQVNTAIFQDVETLQGNIDKVTAALAKAGMTTLHFHIARSTGKSYAVHDGKTWRLMDYISGTSTITEVTPRTAYMTGRAIGEFEAVLAPLAGELGETLPRFHDMDYRLSQFEDAVRADAAGRVAALVDEIDFVRRHADFATAPERAHREGTMPRRVCHCDTKVSNLLFNADGTEVVAVIDLDTVMPSLVFSDMGDFLRTASSTLPEDDSDLDHVAYRADIAEAALEGYLSTATFLNEAERALLPWAAWRFAYMQAVRFLTDYINGDVYYRITYPEHNLVRTRNQIRLAKSIEKALTSNK